MAVKVKTEINDEAFAALRELALNSPANAKKRRVGKALYVCAAVLFAFGAVYSFFKGSYVLAVICLVGAAFCLWTAVAGAQRYQEYLLKKAQSKQTPEQMPKQIEYTFDVKGVTLSSSMGRGTYTWDSFSSWGNIRNFIYVKRSDGQALLVNRNALSSKDAAALTSILNARLAKEE